MGSLSMASQGKDKNGSQVFLLYSHVSHASHLTLTYAHFLSIYHILKFFITTGGSPDYLDDKYTCFGEIAEGLEVLESINSTYCDSDGRPYFDIRILHTYVLDDPFPDPPGLQIPDASPVRDRPEVRNEK